MEEHYNKIRDIAMVYMNETDMKIQMQDFAPIIGEMNVQIQYDFDDLIDYINHQTGLYFTLYSFLIDNSLHSIQFEEFWEYAKEFVTMQNSDPNLFEENEEMAMQTQSLQLLRHKFHTLRSEL
jgi:hypothetical protein